MAMKLYSEEREESGSATFSAAVADKLDDGSEENFHIPAEEEVQVVDPENVDVYVSDEPEAVEEEEKVDPINRLADMLTTRLAPGEEKKVVPKRAAPQAVDMVKLKKDFDTKLHEVDDPSNLVDQYVEAKYGNTIMAQNLEIQKLKRDALVNDPDKKFIMDNYSDDVETMIAELPPAQQNHPDAYDYAINQVTLKNMSALRTHWLEQETKKTPTRVKPGKNSVVGRGAGPSGTGTTKKRVRATKADEANARRYGMTVKQWLVKEGRL